MAKVGRPRDPLPPTRHLLTRRVRRLIDTAHGGNLSDAARATGLSYPTLRALVTGSTRNPSIRTLELLAAPYGLSLDWFATEEPTGIPLAGIVGILPPHPSVPQRRGMALRHVLIPVAAWPMYHVYRRLATWLEAQAPAAGRPIVHEGTGDSFTFRLTTWLLQPLLAAEKLGEPDVIPFAGDDPAPELPEGAVGEHWTRQLEQLGGMWEVVLEDVLDRAPR